MSRNEEFAGDGSVQLDIEPITAHVVAQYHNQNHGSSFLAYGGGRVSSGYIVGGHKGVPETVLVGDKIDSKQYQAHRDHVRNLVKDRSVIAGTWSEKGRSVLDASNAVPSRDEAKSLQIARGERAVYNADAGKSEDLR